MRTRDTLLRHSGKISTALLLLFVGAWFVYTHRGDLDQESLEAFGRQLPAGWFLVAYLLLPLVGFPVSILLLLAGVRFGLGWGMAVVSAGMLFHHFAAFHITHGWFRDRLRSFLQRMGYGIPAIREKHRLWFTAVFAAVHGPPYFAKLYLLALTDIPFRIYLWIGAPVYILFSLVPVAAGAAVARFDPRWLYLAIALFILFSAIGLWLKKRCDGKLPGLGGD
jgi:uncharacterized membrane protein YdjX (TVP38/TMEM64 family)